jgi:hypothetical protein
MIPRAIGTSEMKNLVVDSVIVYSFSSENRDLNQVIL